MQGIARSLITSLVFGFFCGSAWAQEDSAPPRIADLPILNICEVMPDVYQSGRLSDGLLEIPMLIESGLKTLASIQGGDFEGNPRIAFLVRRWEKGETPEERKLELLVAKQNRLPAYNFPVNSLSRPSFRQMKDVEKLLKMIEDPANRPILYHCAHGRDRSGFIRALLRLRQGWTFWQAMREWRKNGHGLGRALFTSPLDIYVWNYSRWMKRRRARFDQRRGCEPELEDESLASATAAP